MPTTSRGYPYPAPGDPADVPADLQSLATSIDTDVSTAMTAVAVTSLGDIWTFRAAASTAAFFPGNNYAFVSLVKPDTTITPTEFCWWCTTQSGNYDVGLIDWGTRTRLWSSGSTACPAAGPVIVPIVAGPTLSAGTLYGVVFAADNATLALASGFCPEVGMTLTYDGDISSGIVSASFPIPATVGVWTESLDTPAIALRA